MNKYIYSFYEKMPNGDIGGCICDGESKEEALDNLWSLMEQEANESEESIEWDVIFCLYDCENNKERFKEVTVSVEYEYDYDPIFENTVESLVHFGRV